MEYLWFIHDEAVQTVASVANYYSCLLERSQATDGSCYLQYDSLTVGWAIVAFFIAYSFVFSIIGNNCSKVDQLWSIVPVIYAWHFHYHDYLLSGAINNPRSFLVSVLITLWGFRLSFNFWRKGGYGDLIHHEEDYRWPILRKKMHPFFFLLFNFSFIASYQNILLYLIAVPAYFVSVDKAGLSHEDYILSGCFLLFFLIETIADEQHWQFQTLKHSLSAEAKAVHPNQEIRDGFFQSGLFKFSRHPNYFGEQSMWVVIYLFSCIHTSSWVNWTLSGCVQLILLFQGSMNFGESITSARYPRYREYQKYTSQCIPWFSGKKAKSV